MSQFASFFVHNGSDVVREHQQGHMGHEPLQSSGGLQSVHDGHGQIENYQVGLQLLRFSDCFRAIHCIRHLQVLGLENARNMRLMIA
jgi:hypothetical protein